MADAPPNPVPSMGVQDYADTLRRMQPRGRIWDNPDDSVMAKLRLSQAQLTANFNAACALLSETESYPPTSELLLPMWEEAFGLPDPCTPLSPTVQQRQQALAGRLAAHGGLSRAALIAVGAAYGYAITITEFKPFRIGINSVDDSIYDQDWLFAWEVNFPAGTSPSDDGFAPLLCTLQRLAPPNTIFFLNSADIVGPAPLGQFVLGVNVLFTL